MPLRARVRGLWWRVLFVSREVLHGHIAKEVERTGEIVERLEGLCDHPNYKRRAVRILDTLRGRRLLEAMIHECLHAACWDLSEDTVREAARDIARLLWRLGWRQDSA